MVINIPQLIEASQGRLERTFQVAFAGLGRRVGPIARDAHRAAKTFEDGGGGRTRAGGVPTGRNAFESGTHLRHGRGLDQLIAPHGA